MNRSVFSREIPPFLGFLILTVIMTWPWALYLRDAVAGHGDPYAIAYWLWWGYHQTFHDPLNLFHATIFYPYKYTLAFSENGYGVSLLFFPLFALGFRPLTVHSVATLTAFVFAGYGMFRLVRTLTNSAGAAWVAGIVFAFIPYHFQRLPHLTLIFNGWIPLLLEALVLFARGRSWRRGIWLAFAFMMNALVSVTWFILTLAPLVLSGFFLVAWFRLLRDRKLWIRGGLPLVAGSLLLAGFLFPYYRVRQMYGFERSPAQVIGLSASPIHWLAVSERNKLWKGLGGEAAVDELTLFPGFLPPFLALAALLLVKPVSRRSNRTLLILLDGLALLLLLIVLLTIGYGGNRLEAFGIFLLVTVFIRVLIARPQIVDRIREAGFISNLRSHPNSLAFALGIIWLVIGVLGSFGMNLFFHRLLYEFVPLFKSMRAPARWAMIAYVGLAILAGLGARQLAGALLRWRTRLSRAAIYVVIAAFVLFEQRVAPLEFARGEVDPDAMTLRLKETPMSGGIVELPAIRDNYAYFRYMLRAADHGRPIVTAAASFAPPILQEIESLTATRPIPHRFIDLLEAIPTSYLVVHNGLLSEADRTAVELILQSGVANGRLRLVHREGEGDTSDDLYVVVKTEAQAPSAQNALDNTQFFIRQQYLDLLNREPSATDLENLVQFVDKCGGEANCLLHQRAQAALQIFRSGKLKETSFTSSEEYNRAFVTMCYSSYLKRDPDPGGYNHWLQVLKDSNDFAAVINGFITSAEYRSRFWRSELR